jgi:hypothetical protein
LILTPSCISGARDSPTERCCRCSASSKSLTVVPSTTVPGRLSTPAATRRASTNEVLPEPAGPTSTTFRMPSGRSALGAVSPLLWFPVVFPATSASLGGA